MKICYTAVETSHVRVPLLGSVQNIDFQSLPESKGTRVGRNSGGGEKGMLFRFLTQVSLIQDTYAKILMEPIVSISYYSRLMGYSSE